MAKAIEKMKAREMRRKGESVTEIAKKLGVSSSTTSLWCRDIKLSQKQIKELERHSRDPNYGMRLANALAQQKVRKDKTYKLHQEGKVEVGKLSKRELFIAGVALYWGEGFKKDSQAGLASMDAGIIHFFIRWLKVCFGYKNEDLIFRLTLNISHKPRVGEVQEYWSKLLGIPTAYFQKPFFQVTTWKKVYENPGNYHGVLRIKVRKSTDFLRKIDGFLDGLRTNAR